MKADVVSNRPAESAESKKSCRLRFLDLSFDAKDLKFKNDELDNGRFPHGGYKGSRRHPLGLYSFDKGQEFHRQLKDDLDLELEREMVGVLGTSPSWALDAHRWPTHTGESPLLAHGFLAASKLEGKNGFSRLPATNHNSTTRAPSSSSCSSSSSTPSSLVSGLGLGGGGVGGSAAGGGMVYCRPTRPHPYLTATEFKDCSSSDCEDLIRYGRPTRTTLLRARQKLNASANSYEMHRQLDQRMEELKFNCAFSNPKELLQLETEVDGETFYSFLTGARYNRANCLDSRSMTQHGVYMSRHNPLGCFVLPQKLDALDTTSAPPDSPRSDTEEGSNQPARPTTAPGLGKKPLGPLPPHTPVPPPISSCGDLPPKMEGVEADIRSWSPQLRIRGNRLPINSSREGPFKFECRLPRLRQMREGTTDEQAPNKQPPPTQVPLPYVRLDNSVVLPAVRPEPEAKSDAAQAQTNTTPPPAEEDKPPEEKTEEEAAGKREEGQKTEEENEETPEVKIEEEQKEADKEEKEDTEKEEEEDKDRATEVDTETPADVTAAQRDVTEDKTSPAAEDEQQQPSSETQPVEDQAQEPQQEESATADDEAAPGEKTEDDVKFFVTEGVGVDDDNTDDVTKTRTVTGERDDATEADNERSEEITTTETDPTEKVDPEDFKGSKESPSDRRPVIIPNEAELNELEAQVTTDVDGSEQGQGQAEPLKVVVTRIERSGNDNTAAPSAPMKKEEEEEEEEMIAQHP